MERENTRDRDRNARTRAARDRYRRNSDPYKDWYYRRNYGITLAQYRERLAAQGGGCAICDKVPRRRALDVDHCHRRGVIRGLLCPSCNTAIGHFRENAKFFAAALAYLERTRGVDGDGD